MQEGEVKPFDEYCVNSAPSDSGIYAIYDETDHYGNVAYIGRSGDIKRRLKEHLAGRGSKTVAMLIQENRDLWFSFGHSSNAYGAEAAELARLSPHGNRKREIVALED